MLPAKVPQPKWILFVRAARALLAVVVLGLCAYTIQIIPMVQAQFNIFVAIFTFLVTVYIFVAEIPAPQAYNKWAILALEIMTLIFWLAGFASLAALAANIDACLDMAAEYGTICYAYRRSYDKRSLNKRVVWDGETAREWYAGFAAAAGMASICFILSIVILAIFCMAIHRQRQSLNPNPENPATNHNPAAPVPMNNIATGYSVPEKTEPVSPVSSPQQPASSYMPSQVPTPTSSPPPPMGYGQPPPMPYQHSGPQAFQQQYQQPTMQPYQTVPSNVSELNASGMPPGRTELRS
jgi:uncharacterized membrane protein YtjA (UPF0391 family)